MGGCGWADGSRTGLRLMRPDLTWDKVTDKGCVWATTPKCAWRLTWFGARGVLAWFAREGPGGDYLGQTMEGGWMGSLKAAVGK